MTKVPPTEVYETLGGGALGCEPRTSSERLRSGEELDSEEVPVEVSARTMKL